MLTLLVTLAGVVLAFALSTFGWVIKELIGIKANVAEVTAAHRNNGGSSTRDAIDRIERKLDAHIHWHLSERV